MKSFLEIKAMVESAKTDDTFGVLDQLDFEHKKLEKALADREKTIGDDAERQVFADAKEKVDELGSCIRGIYDTLNKL